MAGDWIKWTKGLAKRREVVILASKLGRDPHEIAGRLMSLWEWCDENISASDVEEDSQNVSLFIGDKPFEFLDALLGLPGMAEAMASPGVRWIEARSGSRIVFPNLARHNGTSAKTRAYESRKKQTQRSVSPDVSPKMSPNLRDKTGTRVEKRREEINTKDNTPLPLKGGGAVKPPVFSTQAAKAVAIPVGLATPEFVQAWHEWLDFRWRIKKPLQEISVSKQLEKLVPFGPEVSIKAMQTGIANGYQGLFPEKESQHGNAKPSAAANPTFTESVGQLMEWAERGDRRNGEA